MTKKRIVEFLKNLADKVSELELEAAFDGEEVNRTTSTALEVFIADLEDSINENGKKEG